MRALSIRQPWAWLIVHGFKPVENRDWATDYRGPLAIHAGKTCTRKYFDQISASLAIEFGAAAPTLPQFEDLQLGGHRRHCRTGRLRDRAPITLLHW
jgi:hypothetical protein